MHPIHRASFFLLSHWTDPRQSVTLPEQRVPVPATGYRRRRPLLVRAAGVAARLLRRFVAARARRRNDRLSRRQLAQLNDHLLRDIGVTRAQLQDLMTGRLTAAGLAAEREAALSRRPADAGGPPRQALRTAIDDDIGSVGGADRPWVPATAPAPPGRLDRAA